MILEMTEEHSKDMSVNYLENRKNRGRIESMTNEDIVKILQDNDILPKCHDWHKYEKAKRVIFMGLWIDENIYKNQIDFITDYLGLYDEIKETGEEDYA